MGEAEKAESWVKNWERGGRKLQYTDRQLDFFSDRGVTDSQNFDFAPKFPFSGDSQPQILHFRKKICGHEQNFMTG